MPRLRLKDYLVIASGILLIAVSLSFARVNPARSAADETVRVVNTPLPVTLQGTGTISGTVAATQSGAWNVGINNPVSLDPTTTNPVTIKESQRHPFSVSPFCDTTGSSCLVSVPTLTTQRMEVEYISATCETNNEGIPLPALQFGAVVEPPGSNSSVQRFGVNQPNPAQVLGAAIFGQIVKAYVEPGGSFDMFALTGATNINFRCTFGISGVKIDVPQ